MKFNQVIVMVVRALPTKWKSKMVEVISRVINLRWNQKWKYLFNTISFSFNSPYDIDTCDPVKPRLLELSAEVEDPTKKKRPVLTPSKGLPL